MSKLFTTLTDYMVAQQIIPAEDQAIYQYGLQQGFVLLLNILTILALGLLNHMLLESVVFLLAYTPLRTFAGGFHARTQLRCYFGGIVLTQAVLLAMHWIPHTSVVLTLLGLAAFFIIFALSPVADANKPLTLKERNVYRRKAHALLIGLSAVAAVLYALHFSALSAAVVISLDALAIMLLLGYPHQPAVKQ